MIGLASISKYLKTEAPTSSATVDSNTQYSNATNAEVLKLQKEMNQLKVINDVDIVGMCIRKWDNLSQLFTF